MKVSGVAEPLSIEVFFQSREDGGLRAWSPQLPLFVLSHSDPIKVLKDVVPVLETMLSKKMDCDVRVTRIDAAKEPEWAVDLIPPTKQARRYAAMAA